MDPRLNGKTALSAGASQDLVRAIAKTHATEGVKNMVTARDEALLARLNHEILEAGGVKPVGQGVTNVTVGDSVSVILAFFCAEYGPYGELVNAPKHAVVRSPAGLSFEEAAATWMKFTTACGALIEMGDLQAGETVLIGAASSSVGQAAIQIANLVGATPVALTRSSQQRQALVDAGAAHVIAGNDQRLQEQVTEISHGNVARIAFELRMRRAFSGALSKRGIFSRCGALDTRDITVPVMDLLGNHATRRGYELFEIAGDPQKLERADCSTALL